MRLRHLSGIIFIILIGGMIYLSKRSSEGFENRCGVDLPSCSGEHIRCMNGYCKSDIPKLLPISDLSMIPRTKY